MHDVRSLLLLILVIFVHSGIHAQKSDDALFPLSLAIQDKYVECQGVCQDNCHGEINAHELANRIKFYNYKDDLAFVSRLAIRFYQIFISSQNQPSCMFEPSCSAFAIEAISSYGLRGLFMSADRVSRCNGLGFSYYLDNYEDGAFYDPPAKYKRE